MNTAESGTNVPVMTAPAMRPSVASKSPSKLRPGLILLGSLAAAMGVLILITSYVPRGGAPASSAAAAIPAPTAEMPPTAEPAASSPQWAYSEVKAAGGEMVRMGCIQSQNMVFLEEPYDSAPVSLCFRADGAAFLRLDGDGKILSGQGYAANVEFGDGATKSFALQQPDNNSLQMAFLSPASPLFAAARAGTRMTVVAKFGVDVQQTVTFAPSHPLNLTD